MMTSSMTNIVENEEPSNVVQTTNDTKNDANDNTKIVDKMLEYLVIDAGAIIRGHAFDLPHLTKSICTVEEVIGEIKDSKSRQLLTTLPYEIEILTPSDAAMKAVIEFSKKTGDFAALSLTDLKLIALIYTLESKINGNIDLESKFKMLHPLRVTPTTTPKSSAATTTNKSMIPTTAATPIDHLSNAALTDAAIVHDFIGTHLEEQHDVDDDGDDDDDNDDDDTNIDLDEGNDEENEEEDDEVDHRLIKCHITNDDEDDDVDTTHHQSAAVMNIMNEEDFPSIQSSHKQQQQSVQLPPETTNVSMNTDVVQSKKVSSWASVATKSTATTPAPVSSPFSSSSSSSSTLVTSDTRSVTPSVTAAPTTTNATATTAPSVSITESREVGLVVSNNKNNQVKIIGNNNNSSSNSTSLPATSTVINTSTSASADAFTAVATTTTKSIQSHTISSSSSSSSSRILSSGSNTHNPNSTKSNQIMAVEDDGAGWINVNNIAVRRANGTIAMDTSITTIPTAINNHNDMNMNITNSIDNSNIEDDSGWSAPITSTNKKNNNNNTNNGKQKFKKNSNNRTNNTANTIDITNVKVACITTDFSIQNVMLQMGLHLMSIEGMIIQQVKQWVLRCIGCYQIHYELSRLFCSKCGGANLTRVAVSIDKESGLLKLHLKKNYQVNVRGTKYSLPKPLAMKSSHGTSTSSSSSKHHHKFKGDLLLREDQLLSGIWKQKYLNAQHNVKMQHDDVFTDLGFHHNSGANATGSSGSSSSLSNLHHMQDIVVGYGKKNPNAMKGRERRGKAKN